MRSLVRLSRALALAAGLAAVSAFGSLPPAPQPVARSPSPAPEPPLDLGEDIAGFYLERDFRPIWVTHTGLRPEADRFLRELDEAGEGRRELEAAVAAARQGDRRALARADLLLTRAYADHVVELHRPPARP